LPTQLQNSPKIALDTNMLLAIQQLGVDVFAEIERLFGKNAEIALPKQVLAELKELAEKGKGKIGLQEIERHGVKIEEIDAGNADEALLNMSKQGYLVASNDAVLRKRIKGFGGKVIYLRQRNFLEIG